MVKISGKNFITTLRDNMSFLTRAQTTILSAAAILGFTSGLSALLGFVKSRLLSASFGTSTELTIFFTADKIPNLIYSLLVVGGMSTVFIPVYTEALKNDGDKADEIASQIINAGVLLFAVLGGLAFAFAPGIIRLLAVNKFTPEEVILGARLLRLMLGAQIILLVSSFLTSLLHSYSCFILASLAPVLYNLGMIVGILAFSDQFGILGPTYGTLIGAAAHLLIQIPAIRKIRYSYRPIFKFRSKYLRKVSDLLPARLLSVAAANFLATINNSLAILISKPSSIYLKFAGQLQFFPVNLFAVSIASAALPTLSRKAAASNKDKFKKIFITSLHQMLFLVIPCSVILLVLRIPVIRLAYGAKKFPWEATVKTSYTLAFYSISIFAQSTVYLLTRSFYALKDTKTPVKISLVTLFLNIGLSLLFIRILNWGVWAIAFSYSITSILDMLVMFYFLDRSLGGFSLKEVLQPFIKISYAAILMGGALYAPLKLLDEYVFDSTRTIQLLFITILASLVGVGTYLLFTKLLKVEEVELLHKLLYKLNVRGLLKQEQGVEESAEIKPVEA
ncbi:murein biosynthesis integral membrane protein MurJ [candidate division WWE3 bacterium]|nr:murein biosynthesis integral membrane protein MurJ [candidate division WWE3 bacterium]